MERTPESGLRIDDSKLTDFRPPEKLGQPREYPFTRGVCRRMYAERPWTTRQHSGFAPAGEANRELIEAGRTRLDLPAQMGCDGKRLVAGVSRFTINGRTIAAPKKAAESADNVLYPLRDAPRPEATLGTEGTLGEVCDALRDVWGEYQPGEL
jgi:methylmalonyl-CoA mutase N-terminal domain/subunit